MLSMSSGLIGDLAKVPGSNKEMSWPCTIFSNLEYKTDFNSLQDQFCSCSLGSNNIISWGVYIYKRGKYMWKSHTEVCRVPLLDTSFMYPSSWALGMKTLEDPNKYTKGNIW